MKQKYMLFYRESDAEYYFFNGVHPICVSPAFQLDHWLKSWPLNTLEMDIAVMRSFLNNGRLKLMIIRKVRYVIQQRGEFIIY